MSPTESVILNETPKQFRLFEAALISKMTMPSASTTLRRMIDKGYLKRVKRGLHEKL